MSNKKVLVVEDESLTRNVLVQMVESLAYDVDSCENGEQAIKKITEFQPDLIISDILMPEYSGLQLLNFVQKKIKNSIPILIISSMEEGSMEELVEDIGAVGFISKPPSKKDLQNAIEQGLKS